MNPSEVSASAARAVAALQEARIEAHLRFLANPLLEGRAPGSRGGRIAEEYIRSAFARALLEPPRATGFLQEVPMIAMEPDPELSFLGSAGGQIVRPAYRDDFVLEAGVPDDLVELEAELVFAGFGIHAPEYGWDDFGEESVAGKVLLVRVNDPGTPDRPDFFEGGALTYYGRWTYKFEEAARRGAAGAILIHTTESAGYGWNVVRNSNTGERFHLAAKPEFPLPIRGWITEPVARALLAGGGLEPDVLFAASERSGFRAGPTGVTVRARVRSAIREIRTANVLGLWPGTDPALAEEPVILMAHHDHLGTAPGASGAVVYPGAYDNASGVALLLAIGEALAETRTRLPRPLLFLATTAEESGLLGAKWYTQRPISPLERTAAVLNIDGANLQGPTRDIAPLGVERSTLGQLVTEAAAAESLELVAERHPEQGMFFRQDHFPFVLAGVPAIAFDHGLTYAEKPPGWGDRWYEEFVACHYHQPTDAFREDFDYRGAVQQGAVMLRTALAVARARELPDWRPGSAFRRTEVS